MSRKYLGLDIQQDALCAVLMEGGLKSRSIDSCLRIPIPGTGSFQDELDQALDILFAKMSLAGCAGVLSVPIDKVTCRNMQVPFADSKRIRQVLPFELEPLLPFPVENLVIDFQKIRENEEGAQILTIVGQVSGLNPFLETVTARGIDPETLLPGACAIGVHLSERSDMPDSWLLIDIHRDRCSLLVVLNRSIAMMRSFPISLASPVSISAICRQILHTLSGIEDIFEADIVHTDRLSGGIFVTGPGAENDIFLSELSRGLDLPVSRLNLVDRSGLDIKNSVDNDVIPHLMNNALACALLAAEGTRGGLNLRQGPLAAKGRFFEYKRAFFRTGVFAAVAILFAFGNLISEIVLLEKEVSRLNHHMITLFGSILPDVKRVVDPVQQIKVEIEELKKKAFAAADTSGYLPAIDILLYLSRDIPAQLDVKITKLVAGDQSILISGTTDSFNAVNEMKSHLEKNSLFKVVKINSADMEQTEKRVRFKIQIQL